MPDALLRVASIRGKGRGVIAARDVAKGEVIDRSPVLVLPGDEWPHLLETAISRYVFTWRDGTDDTAMVLSRCSFLNHSYTPNAYAQRLLREREMEFVALRDIAEGEEITINYNGDPDNRAPVGFTVRR